MTQSVESLFPVFTTEMSKNEAMQLLKESIERLGYTIVEIPEKPWGATFRMSSNEAERFIEQFFPGLTMKEAQLGVEGAELSPKFMLFAPGTRISWQYHNSRAERWRFISDGGYYVSDSDEMGSLQIAKAGEQVQFNQGVRHRGCANIDGMSYTLVAEIWQHTDSSLPSDEDDIVRLQDDYKR